MSLVNLTTETMVILSGALLDPKKKPRKQLTSLPLLVPLVPVLQRAHDSLVETQEAGSAIEAEVAAIQAEEAKRDQRHDRKIRGTHGVLTAFAELTDDAELATRLLDLRDRLLPIGTRAVGRSYVDEAGDAKRLPARLDPASRKLLSKLPVADGPLQSHVDAWLEEAGQLGALEERRDDLSRRLATGEGSVTAAQVVAARNAWIRAVRAIEANLMLDPKATPDMTETLLGPLRRAEAKADRRRGTGANPENEDTLDLDPADANDDSAPATPGTSAEHVDTSAKGTPEGAGGKGKPEGAAQPI